ncbi:MAG: hypothetical protein ACLFQV_09770 [Vulcanimicrobiota bacterium]
MKSSFKLIILIILVVLATAIPSLAGETQVQEKNDKTSADITKTELNSETFHQEFIWDEEAGSFKVINFYSVDELENHLEQIQKIMEREARKDQKIVGKPEEYKYYDGESWKTEPDITRYEGWDFNSEAIVHRYDKPVYLEENENKTESKEEEKYITSYKPILEVFFSRNNWKMIVESSYFQKESRVEIKSSDGLFSYLLTPANFVESAPRPDSEQIPGSMILELGEYTISLNARQTDFEESFIDSIRINGPNNYYLIFQNHQARVKGGLPQE